MTVRFGAVSWGPKVVFGDVCGDVATRVSLLKWCSTIRFLYPGVQAGSSQVGIGSSNSSKNVIFE